MAQLPASLKEFSEETRESSPANFLMKIESFSLLSKYGVDKFESRSFEAGGYKWKLILNFEGNEDKNEDDHVSVYFSITECDSLEVGWEVNAIFTFFVYNQLLDNYLCFRGTTRRFNVFKPKWGLSKLISKNSLIDPSKGYVLEDSCVFGAEIFVVKPQRINECLSLIEHAALYKREWKISDVSKLENDVWNSEEFEVGNHNWKVKLYAKGNAMAKDRYISIFVDCVEDLGPHKKVKAEVTLRIKSKINDNHHSKKYDRWFTSSAKHWGYLEFMPIGDMSSRGFLVDYCCFLEVEITVQALALDAPKI